MANTSSIRHRRCGPYSTRTSGSAGPLSPPREAYPCGWLKQVERYDWSLDNSVEIENGWIVKGDTIRELAEKLGIDPNGLENQIARFNSFAQQGEDPEFGRSGATLAPIIREPFYGYMWGNLLINTGAGWQGRRDRVLHLDGTPIRAYTPQAR